MDAFLCIIVGIHDVPGDPRPGDVVLAETADEALAFAADRYGLATVPSGSSATRTDQPALGAKW